MKKMNKLKRSKRRGQRGQNVIPHPPSYESSVLVDKVFRFQANASLSATTTVTNVLDLLYTATSSTAGYRVIDAFKIKKLRVWAPPNPASSTPASASIQWYTTSGSFRQVADVSMGQSEPAFVESRPPMGDLRFWIGTGSSLGNLFLVTGPAGTIVDLHIIYRITINLPGVVVTNSNGIALGAGTTYLNYLDGTTKKLPPLDANVPT